MLSLALFSSSVALASKKERRKKALKIFFQLSFVNTPRGVIYCDDPNTLFCSSILELYCRIGKQRIKLS